VTANRQISNAPPEAPPLRLLFWESTWRCNLACKHCRRLATNEQDAKAELTTEQAKRVFDSAATLGRPIIVFSGGEPLLRDDWEPLAQYARSLELPTALATNGTLIDQPMAERIAGVGFHRVAVSLDGADASTHDGFRGIDGAFDRTMDAIAALGGAGATVQINATIAAHNVDQLPQLYALARSCGAVAMHLFLLVLVGCGVEIAETHQLSPQMQEQVLRWICDRQPVMGQPTTGRQTGQLELKATCAPQYYRIAAERGMDTGHSRGCLCGTAVVFVSHDGQVFPCGYLPVDCGSVLRAPLADIWRDSPVFAKLRDFDNLKGKCGRCEYRDVCGGCRARAFAATGDYLAAEPACPYQPKKGYR